MIADDKDLATCTPVELIELYNHAFYHMRRWQKIYHQVEFDGAKAICINEISYWYNRIRRIKNMLSLVSDE